MLGRVNPEIVAKRHSYLPCISNDTSPQQHCLRGLFQLSEQSNKPSSHFSFLFWLRMGFESFLVQPGWHVLIPQKGTSWISYQSFASHYIYIYIPLTHKSHSRWQNKVIWHFGLCVVYSTFGLHYFHCKLAFLDYYGFVLV